MKKVAFLIVYLCFASYLNLKAQSKNGYSYQNSNAQSRNGYLNEVYTSMLSDEDLDSLRQGNELFFNFIDERSDVSIKGKFRVIPTSTSGVYNFVEIGEWLKLFDFKGINYGNKQVRIETTFDSLGNIIKSKAFEKQANQTKYNLKEELILNKEVINGKLYCFHLVKSYYKTGELWIEGYQRILDFDIPKSHLDKISVPAKYERKYDKSGKLKKEKIYSLTGE